MMKIGRFLQLVVLILIAAGAQPTLSSVYQWSTTASNNATADPAINWAEGQSPSSINDSARAMMAAIATWNRDISGFAATGGTASAITFTSQSGFSSLSGLENQHLTFIAIQPNNAGATLNVDGTGAAPILSANGVPIAANTFATGGVYTVTYYAFDGSYHLWNAFSNPYNVPLGGLIQSTISTPPNANFIAAGGQCISTTTYAAYWTALGSPASGSCPGGQFAVLDSRGRALVALDTLGPLGAAGRLTTSSVGCGTAMTSMGASCANGGESKALAIGNINAFTPTVSSASVNLSGGSAASPIRTWVTGGGGSSDPTHISTGSNLGSDAGSFSSPLSGVLTPSITMNSLGSGVAHPSIDPNIAIYIYIRVL